MQTKKRWFIAKTYGWGWTPATWQGWVVLISYIIINILNFVRIDASSHSSSDTLIQFIPQTCILTLILIGICYKKGERPYWRWGSRHTSKGD